MPLFTSETVLILFIICIGVVLLVAGIFSKRQNEMHVSNETKDIQEELKAVIEEAEHTIKEINQYSEYVIKEMETKYKDILFLYQLIDEKEKQLKDLYKSSNSQYTVPSNNHHSQIQEKGSSSFLSNPSSKQIIHLYSQGKTIGEIAKELNIGKGQVELVVGLAKLR